jgi:ribosomal protein S12 methylthiotransferase accessory factor
MEAGAILHNGGLSAAPLGLGYATIGGYYENVVAGLCGLAERELVLGSAIFGPRPTPAQLRMVDDTPEIDFAWVDGASARFAMPFHLARARVRTAEEDRPYTWGRDTDARLACLKAVAEAIEREGFREPRAIVDAPLAELPTALDPREFVRYDDAQYAGSRFPYKRFEAGHRHAWATGIDLRDGAPVHVLAELVFARAGLAAAGHATDRPYTQVTSSGCAAGTDADDATRRALLEVIERDAFMRHWLAQRPGQSVARARIPKPVSERLAAIEAAGCRVAVQRLESPWAHVCLVAAQHEGLHFTTMGTAAAGDFAAALAGALDELEARVYAWLHGHASAVVRPQDVATTEHHFELYGLTRHFRRADRVLFPAAGAPPLGRLPARLRIDGAGELVARLAARGLRPIAVDITPARNGVDQGRRRLAVVKALVPGLLPMSFGHGREPRGMLEHVHPASTFPHPFP